MPPKKHGPCHQISYIRKGKSSTKFVRTEDLPAIRKQLKNYENVMWFATSRMTAFTQPRSASPAIEGGVATVTKITSATPAASASESVNVRRLPR